MTARSMRSLLAVLVLGLLGATSLGRVEAADATPPAATETSSSAPFVGTRTDTTLPIEITADTLEVKQSEQRAIFRGRVDALQGELRLRADELVVHYRENQKDPDQPGISKIEAEGNVFISSPKETGKGARGVYDVDRARIDLVGDVVLTQGKNVVKGDTLKMNLATGESKVASGKAGDGRVKGLFVPDKKPVAGAGDQTSQKKN